MPESTFITTTISRLFLTNIQRCESIPRAGANNADNDSFYHVPTIRLLYLKATVFRAPIFQLTNPRVQNHTHP